MTGKMCSSELGSIYMQMVQQGPLGIVYHTHLKTFILKEMFVRNRGSAER